MHRNSLQVLQSRVSINNEPIQLIREKLAELLRALNLPSETIDQVSQAYFSSPQVSLISILLSAHSQSTSPPSRDETNKKASVPSSNQEVGLETKLSLIEGKYEKILQQVTELVNSDLSIRMRTSGGGEEEGSGEITHQWGCHP